MKKTALLFALFLFALGSSATNYYFSSSTGNDSRSSTQAKNPATPWKTIGKLNSFFSSLKAGDSVLFKRGDTFYGTLLITKSGTSSAPVVLGAYGSGDKPVVSGFTKIAGWASVGSGVYESSSALPSKKVNVVLMNGDVQQMGRYPNATAANKGWLYFESHRGTSSITDKELSSSTNWKGAEMIIRAWKSAIDRVTITAHSGGTLSGSLTYEPHDGFGYFIQNDVRTLDAKGEWFFNKSTRKLRLYNGSSAPSSSAVLASTLDTLVYATDRSYVNLNGLSFQGANLNALYLRYCDNIKITGCEFLYSGGDAIHLKGSSNLTVTGNRFAHSFTNAISTEIGEDHWTISDNVIENTAMYEGLCQKDGQVGYAIYSKGNNHTIERNTIDNTGYCPVRFSGNDILIKNNVITNFNMIKNDGAAIYTWHGGTSNRKIIGNIILHGHGANEGLGMDGSGSSASGIYFDNEVTGVEVSANTVADCSKTGIYLHNAYGIKVRDNTLFDNGRQLVMTHDGLAPDAPLRKMNVKSNIFFAKAPDQYALSVNTNKDDLDEIGAIDSNYHCRPVNETFVNYASHYNSSGKRIFADYDLRDWQLSYSPYDKNSRKTARQLPTYTINSFLGSNKFSNGSFSSSISGMFATSGSSWVSSKLDGGTYQGKVSSTSTGFQLIPPVGSVSSSKNYIVRFSAQSTKDTVISVYLRQSSSPYTKLSDVIEFKVGTTRKEYEFLFPHPASQSNTGLVFSTDARGFTFWLDNIKLYEAEVTMLDLDNLVRFEYNATKTSKTINLGSTAYTDIKNKVYTGSVTLQPYTSIILLKDVALPAMTAIAETETHEVLPVALAEPEPAPSEIITPTNFRLKNAYPNPSSGFFNLVLEATGSEPISLNVYNISGRLVERKAGVAANTVVQFGHALPRGMYVVQAIQGKQTANMKVTKL